MNKNLKHTLVLDYNFWICGCPDKNRIKNNCNGKGETSLLNKDGYMCCLGQFALQSGFSLEELFNKSLPTNELCGYNLMATLADINDNMTTSLPQKIKAIKSLLANNKKKLVLKNFPKSIVKNI